MIDWRCTHEMVGASARVAAAALLLTAIGARATGCIDDDSGGGGFFLVKKSEAMQIFVADQNCNIDVSSDIIDFDWVFLSFTNGRSATAASGSEPAHTGDPILETGFSVVNGAQIADYTFFPKSLHDIGTYIYKWTGTSCSPNGQGGTACGPMQEDSTGFPVDNSPPAASLSVSGDIHVGHTVTFNAGASDADHGTSGLHFTWSVPTKPASAAGTLSSSTASAPTMALSSKHDIGNWSVHLVLDDQEGERKQFDKSFTVENQVPTLTITGPTDIDALEDIQFQAGPDTDADGETVTFSWDIVSAPPGASLGAQSAFDTSDAISIPTNAPDIGIWHFHCTATDEHGATVSKDVQVEVHAVPPKIALEGPTEIDVGETIHQATTELLDAYGEPLQFDWELIQVPLSAGMSVPSSLSGSASLDIPTTDSSAGTWGLRLTVTDHIGETATEVVYVLVDGLPDAVINAPTVAGNLTSPIVFDGSASIDPDSPDTMNHGHLTSEPPVQVSMGLVQYIWRIVQVPPDAYGQFFEGSVADVLNINGNSPTLNLPAGTIPAGTWTFELEVTDAEGNVDFEDHAIDVIDEGMPPIPIILGPSYFLTDIAGNTSVDILADGSFSFDLDNLLSSPMANGLGITRYQWGYVSVPLGCAAPPSLPDGASASIATLYTAGSQVPGPCQGAYNMGLTVTDDDTPTKKTAFGSQLLFIGNCPGDICIDYPLQVQPQYIKFSDQTDVIVYYHLNSVLYDAPSFLFGMRLQLRVFHESDPTAPMYDQAWDLDMLPTNKGGYLAVHWSGFDNFNNRPQSGKYSIEVDLYDAVGGPTASVAREDDAVRIQTLDVAIDPTTTRYVRGQDLQSSVADITVDYSVTGAAPGDPDAFDELRWRVYQAGTNTLVANGQETSGLSINGAFHWNGDKGGGQFLAPGDYDLELTLLDQGAQLGVSPRVPLTVYDFDFKIGANVAPDTLPGTRVFANVDDDNNNAVIDSSEVAAGEDDLVKIDLAAAGFSQGTATLATTAPAGSLKVWTTAAKGAEIVLPKQFDLSSTPLPASVFIEGLTASQGQLTVSVTMPDATVLGPFSMRMTIAELRLWSDSNNDHAITAADTQVFWARVGRWNKSYDASNNPQNAAGNAHLVEQDADRFYVQVRDPAANADPAAVDTLTVKIGTLDKANAVDDDLTDITLTETGVNTGDFLSQSQLLMSSDLPLVPDDDFAAHDGTTAAVADDAAGDRTHRALIDGSTRLTYQPAGLPSAKPWTVPVCLRTPEERRKAEIRVVIFNEPFQDVGYDDDNNAATPVVGAGDGVFSFTDTNHNLQHDAGEPSEPFMDISTGAVVFANTGSRGGVATQADVDAHVARANLAWEQDCISIVNLGTTFADAPKNAGVDILADGSTDIASGTNADEAAVVAAYAASSTVDVIRVFYTAPAASWWGLSRTPSDNVAGMGELTFMYIDRSTPLHNRTFAHELGHVLTNDFDRVNPLWIFYPNSTGGSATNNDDVINQRRRLEDQAALDARKLRPSGNKTALGNRILKLP